MMALFQGDYLRFLLGIPVVVSMHIAIVGFLLNDQSQDRLSQDSSSVMSSNMAVRFSISPSPTLKNTEKLIEKPQKTSQKIKDTSPKVVTRSTKRQVVKTKPVNKEVKVDYTASKKTSQQSSQKGKISNKIKQLPQKTVVKSFRYSSNNTIPVVEYQTIRGQRIKPKYPKRALRMGQQGVVWLRVLVDENGERQEIKLHKPSRYALLNQAALNAVKKWKFAPHLINGHAKQSWVEIPIEFKIQ
jgi:protein TonB